MTIRCDSTNFEEHLLDAVRTFFRDTHSRDGCPRTIIDHAKSRLQCGLPSIVERYFSILGQAKDLNHSFYQILSPSEIQVRKSSEHDFLILAHSHQQVSSFGVVAKETSDDDPPVMEIVENDEALAFERASSFYCFTVLWQIINDLVPYRATCYPGNKEVRQIKKESVAITFSRSNTGDLHFFRQGDCLLLLTTEGRKTVIAVGGRKNQAVTTFCERYGLKITRLRKRA